MKLLSPPGLAGIAVIAVAADERVALLQSLATPAGQSLRLPGTPCVVRAVLQLDGAVVDDVLVIVRRDQQLELHVHGSPAVLEQLNQRFGVLLCEAASPAENLMREALSIEQFAVAAEQMSTDFPAELARLQAMPMADRRTAVAAARERSRIAQALVEPMRVVLVGQQNAGKSSLFNQLLFRERALTGATPGLTRDAIAEVTTLTGYPYELVDTAGEGEASSDVDMAAIDRGRGWRAGAWSLLLVDGSVGPQGNDRELAAQADLVLTSKADLPQAVWPSDWVRDGKVSCHAGSGDATRTMLGEILAARRGLPMLPRVAPLGGFAALNEQQRQQLFAIDADCSAAPPSA